MPSIEPHNGAMHASPFNRLMLTHWEDFVEIYRKPSRSFDVDGCTLNVPAVVAAARHDLHATFTSNVLARAERSHEVLKTIIDKGAVIYGVNTGFGGSADTRPRNTDELQDHLISFLNIGVLHKSGRSSLARPIDHPDTATSMPESWVRAAILIRLNTLASGASGIKVSTLRALASLLEHDIVPVVPLRGSISASGDLSPLSYVGAALQGRSSSEVYVGKGSQRRRTKSGVALRSKGLAPIRFGPKEGLSLVNGTAVSAAVGSLAMHEMIFLTTLSQIITAMSVECLQGTDESFDQFIADMRPHQGQQDSAQNMYSFLQGSGLVKRDDGSEGGLRQDRYATRTASQWIGPVIEDVMLSYTQITTELNSVTDNPLVDPGREKILNGGNFQARSVTSAMEKIRQGCDSLGRMVFAQCTEIVNPSMNRGLPPNLAVDEPSESYLFKGVDISLAAYQSELGFLANPVSSHIMPAEMGDQSLNSMALVSGRYTIESITVLSQLCAAAIVVQCQALDLRAMNKLYEQAAESRFKASVLDNLSLHVTENTKTDVLQDKTWRRVVARLSSTTSMDSSQRFDAILEDIQPLVLSSLRTESAAIEALRSWTAKIAEDLRILYLTNRDKYSANPDASPCLGHASKKIYKFVRNDLGVPFLCNELLSTHQGTSIPAKKDVTDDAELVNGHVHAEANGTESVDTVNRHNGVNGHKHSEEDFDFGTDTESTRTDKTDDKSEGITIGGLITQVYESIRDGSMWPTVIECLSSVDGLGGEHKNKARTGLERFM